MALTAFETQMVEIIHKRCTRKTDPRLAETHQARLATLLGTDEAAIRQLIADVISEDGLVAETASQITNLNAKVVELTTLKASMESYSP